MNTAKKFTLILIFIIAVAALGGLLFLRVTAAPEPTPLFRNHHPILRGYIF